MRINIESIPNEEMRYITCGDYWVDDDGIWQIRVSESGDWRYNFLVAIHELAEQALVINRGISEPEITEFDKRYEENRPEGNNDEPGDDPKSPYYEEHCIATAIERIMCAELGLNWKEYDDLLNSL